MLGDDLAAVLPQLQAQAESMMRTRCRILHVSGVTIDPQTGVDTPVFAEVPVFVGPCKIQDRDLQATPAQIPGSTVPVFRLEVHIPVSAATPEVGDVVQTFADDDVEFTTPLRTLRITATHRKTWQSAQRLPVEEL